MANDYFRFKQFTVRQERCSMKVGTDGVLIGAWAALPDVPEPRLLDVGAGTGVVSLMLAQRCPSARVDAVELDPEAAAQAGENFEASPWKDRLHAYCSPLQAFDPGVKYDAVISNPPYFVNSLKAEGGRALARHADTLPYGELADGVLRLLAENGRFSAIFPYVESNLFIVEAALRGLYCNRRMEVRGTGNKPVKRVLLEMSREKTADIPVETLVIEHADDHMFTEKYRELTRGFYLKF